MRLRVAVALTGTHLYTLLTRYRVRSNSILWNAQISAALQLMRGILVTRLFSGSQPSQQSINQAQALKDGNMRDRYSFPLCWSPMGKCCLFFQWFTILVVDWLKIIHLVSKSFKTANLGSWRDIDKCIKHSKYSCEVSSNVYCPPFVDRRVARDIWLFVEIL